MDLFNVESRLQICEAINGEVNGKGETLVRLNGRLHEVNINEVLEWIPGTLKELEKSEQFFMAGWNTVRVGKESAAEFRTQTLRVQALRGRIESIRVRLLELKHKPKEKESQVEGIRADIKQVRELLAERIKEHEKDGKKYVKAYVKGVLRYNKAKPTGVELARLEGSAPTWSRKLKDRYILGQILIALDREKNKKGTDKLTLLLNAESEIAHLMGRSQDAMKPARTEGRKCEYCQSEEANEGEIYCETCRREVLQQQE